MQPDRLVNRGPLQLMENCLHPGKYRVAVHQTRAACCKITHARVALHHCTILISESPLIRLSSVEQPPYRGNFLCPNDAENHPRLPLLVVLFKRPAPIEQAPLRTTSSCVRPPTAALLLKPGYSLHGYSDRIIEIEKLELPAPLQA